MELKNERTWVSKTRKVRDSLTRMGYTNTKCRVCEGESFQVLDMMASSNSCIRFLASSAVLLGLGGGVEILLLRSDSRSFIRSLSASSVSGIGEGEREERSGFGVVEVDSVVVVVDWRGLRSARR